MTDRLKADPGAKRSAAGGSASGRRRHDGKAASTSSTSAATSAVAARESVIELEEILERQSRLVEEHRRTVLELHASMVSLGAVVEAIDGAPTATSVAAIAPEHIAAQTESLIESASTVRSCVRSVDTGPGIEEGVVNELQQRIAGGLIQRAIYDATIHDSTSGQAWMRTWANAGEQQRVVPNAPVEFAVFGEAAVVAATDWDHPEAGYALIKDPMLVRVYAALFDAVYATGFPPAFADSSDQGVDGQLLELLGLGMKDEAIARHLGLGLRTVRRRVAALMDQHLVSTRFQLGAATASVSGRRSVRDRPERPTPRWR